MTPSTLLLSGLAAFSLSAPALGQGAAGTPPLTSHSNANAPLLQVPRLTRDAVHGAVTTDHPRYRRGQPVRIRFSVVNMSRKAVTYNFSSGQKYDILIKDAHGAEVWDWAKGRVFTQNLTTLALEPGRPVSCVVVWNGVDQAGENVKPGVYTITVRLTSQNRPAVTGGFVVSTDRDPNNMGMPTQTPAEAGAIRQVDMTPPASATQTITIR